MHPDDQRPPENGAGGMGIGPLLASLLQDLQDVVRAEIQLAKTELKEEATAAGRGLATIGAGAVVGLVGFIVLMLAVAYLLAVWLPLWVAAGIVGLVLLVVAAILLLSGKRALSVANLKPEQTLESLQEDAAWASRQINSAKR